MADSKFFRVGVLLTSPVQLLDLAPVDLFGMLHRDYLETCKMPKPILDLSQPVEIEYIGSQDCPAFQSCTANAAL